MVKYIKADGTEEVKEKSPTIEEAQEFVCGYVEMIKLNYISGQLLCNEDGLRLKLQPNIRYPKIVGNIIILTHEHKWR